MVNTSRGNARRTYKLIRSVILAVSTLAVVGVLFSVYQYSTGVQPAPPTLADPPRVHVQATESAAESAEGVSIGDGSVGRGERITISLYEPDSDRARAELEVSDYKPTAGADNEFHLVEPEIRLRTPDGQLVRVKAQQGWIQLVGGDMRNPHAKSGRLVGAVEIDVDRRSAPARAADDAPAFPEPHDLIHIQFDDIIFDLEESRLEADGRFQLTMAEAALFGTGLRLRYNDVDSRVELIEIKNVERLEMTAARDIFDASVPGTGATRVSATDHAESVSSARGPLASGRTIEQQAGQATPQPRDTSNVSSPAGADSTDSIGDGRTPADDLPIFHPDGQVATKPRKPQTYRVDITKDVEVRQLAEAQEVWNLSADSLALIFDFGQRQREAARRGDLPDPVTANPVTADPDNSNSQDAAPQDEPASHNSMDERVMLTCAGSLVMRPVHTAESEPESDVGKRMQLLALGNVHYADGRANMRCQDLDVRKETQEVRIVGDESNPVVLTTANCAELVAVEVFVDRMRGRAHLVGPARLSSYEPEASTADGIVSGDTSSDRPVAVDIRFRDAGEFELARHIVRRMDPETGAWEHVELEYISQATFYGHVEMRQGADLIVGQRVTMSFDPPDRAGSFVENIRSLDASGEVVMIRGQDRITCGQLNVVFTQDPTGQIIPRVADARGQVLVSQASAVIEANEHVTIEFLPILVPPLPFDIHAARQEAVRNGVNPADVDWDEVQQEHERRIEYRVGLGSIVAKGQVRIEDPARDIFLETEQLSSTFAETGKLRRAQLHASPDRFSFVRMAGMSVRGRNIDVDYDRQDVVVPGNGALTMVTRRGLDGSLSPTPRNVAVQWDDGMAFRGAQNVARFNTNVRAITHRDVEAPRTILAGLGLASSDMTQESAIFECDELLIHFEDRPAAVESETNNQDQWWILAPLADRFKQEDGQFAARWEKDPVYLLANRAVKCVFANHDGSTGQLKSRVHLATNRMAVDQRSELMTVPEKGTLLIEDYTGGTSSDPGNVAGLLSSGASSAGVPSQSYIEWADSMAFHFGRNRADFRKDVVLIHRRGLRMAYAESLIPADPAAAVSSSQPGRMTQLECGSLVVEFDETAASDASAALTGAGRMSVGEIRQLDASESVTLTDDDFTIVADRIAKFPESELLRVYGIDGRDAEIYSTRPDGPRFRGPEFTFHTKSGQIEAAGRHELRIRR